MNRIWMIVLLCIAFQVTAFAVPEYINYQARIFDDAGAPMQGTYSISFSVFDATREGTMVWGPYSCDGQAGEGHGDLAVVWDGWFNVILGPRDTAGRSMLSAFDPQDGKPRFVEIQVQGETISPRQQFLAAPYAMEGYHSMYATYALHGVPPGCIMAYYGTSAPEGWLLCDGSVIPASPEYDALRGIVGPSTPDLRGRMILGFDGGVERVRQPQADAVGAAAGEDYHLLTAAEMPTHRHSFQVNTEGYPDGGTDTGGSYKYWNEWRSGRSTIYTTYAGSDSAHNNMPPYMTLNWIIKY